MAGTTVNTRTTGHRDSDVQVTRLEYNKLVDDVEVLRAGLAATAAKVNAILATADHAAIVALEDVVVTTFDAAGDMAAAKVADHLGNTTK